MSASIEERYSLPLEETSFIVMSSSLALMYAMLQRKIGDAIYLIKGVEFLIETGRVSMTDVERAIMDAAKIVEHINLMKPPEL